MAETPKADARHLHRLRVELDVTPIWWGKDWVLATAEVHSALQKLPLPVLQRISEVCVQAHGVIVVLDALSTATLADLERERLRIWQDLNHLAKGRSERQLILSQAHNALRDQLSALQNGVLAKPVSIPPNACPGLARLLGGASSIVTKPKGSTWSPGAAAAP
jgi:hypothetical protein